jgi:hypothetical protein
MDLLQDQAGLVDLCSGCIIIPSGFSFNRQQANLAHNKKESGGIAAV